MRKYILLAIVLFIALVAFPQIGKAAELKSDLTNVLAGANGNTLNYAELSLQQVARHDREWRYANGSTWLIIGGSIALLGANHFGDNIEATDFFALGGIAAGVGGLYFLIPSRSEIENTKVQKISDLAERELGAEDSLEYLAEKALVKRIVNGLTSLGIAGYDVYLYSQSDEGEMTEVLWEPFMYHAASSIGSAFYNLFFPSYVERVNHRVKQYKAQD